MEINIGLIGASGIIGSLLAVGYEKDSRVEIVGYGKWMRTAIWELTVSVFLSVAALVSIIVSSLLGVTQDSLPVTAMTLGSLIFFAISTATLAALSMQIVGKRRKDWGL